MVPSNADGDAHLIRLLGPYECNIRNAARETQNTERETELTRSRVKVPLDLGQSLPADFRGTVTLERAFGLPTNLGDQQGVDLMVHFDGPPIGQITLNGVALTPRSQTAGVICCDARAYLQSRNRVSILIDFDQAPAGNLSEVSIRIVG